MVNRYGLVGEYDVEIAELEDGDYVRYEDFALLANALHQIARRQPMSLVISPWSEIDRLSKKASAALERFKPTA